MVFLRTKLQMYRFSQIKAFRWLIKSVKKHPGLYICAALYASYFGYFRQRWMFVKSTIAADSSVEGKKKT